MIKNPLYLELIKHKLINDHNLIEFSNKTRDSRIKVYKDKVSKIIFLEKYIRKNKYYKNKKNSETLQTKNLSQNSITKLMQKKIITQNLNDDFRRYMQFKKIILNKNILDFGCGWGGFLNQIKSYKSLNGVELRQECCLFIEKKLKKIKVNRSLSEVNKKIDVVTLFHVLEHIPDQISLLKNLNKILSKKGKIIIEVPHAEDFLLNINDLKEFKNFSLWSEHLILHTERSLKKFLFYAGFKNIKISFYQRYNFANHLYWFLHRKPGGHEKYKKNIDNQLNDIYKKGLENIKKTDTIIAVAEK